MLILSHKQLETVIAFLETRPDTPNVGDIYAYFRSRLVESNAMFSVTLEYPTTVVEDEDILKLFVIEVVSRTSPEDMQDFYKKRALVTAS